MIESSFGRAFVVGILLLGQFGLAVSFGSIGYHTTSGDIVFQEELPTEDNDFIGSTVDVSGTVIDTDPVRIRVQEKNKEVVLTVHGLNQPVDIGDRIQINGEMVTSRTLQSNRAIVVPRWGLWYTWSISFLAGLWVLKRLLHHWQVDVSTLAIAPRESRRKNRNNRSSHSGKRR